VTAGGAGGVAGTETGGFAGCGAGWAGALAAGALLTAGGLVSAGARSDGRLVAQPASTHAQAMSAAVHSTRNGTDMNPV
jgi:hypothetical protein